VSGEPVPEGTPGTGRDSLTIEDLLEGRDPRQAGSPGREPPPGHDLVPVRAGMADAPHHAYRALFARIDEARALVEDAQARLDAARAELAAVERLSAEVDARGHEMWSRVRRRMGRRGRALEALPAPDPDALPETNVDGLLDEAAADVAGDAQRPLALRVPRPLALPVCGVVSGAVGYLFARLWVGLTGVNVAGALGLVALVLAPLGGVAVALHWRARYHDEPVETEPGPALVGFAFAAVAEAALFVAGH
jgi:hypothetical protein